MLSFLKVVSELLKINVTVFLLCKLIIFLKSLYLFTIPRIRNASSDTKFLGIHHLHYHTSLYRYSKTQEENKITRCIVRCNRYGEDYSNQSKKFHHVERFWLCSCHTFLMLKNISHQNTISFIY